MERMSDFSFTDKSVSKTSHVESKTCSNFSKNSTKCLFKLYFCYPCMRWLPDY